jgi:hypothetical protein
MKRANDDSINTAFNGTNYVGTAEICVTLQQVGIASDPESTCEDR